jgi:hypothetical protein
MAQNYTRQSSFADGDTITASLFNNEYNQLVNAFTYSSTDVDATGHRHDGTSGEGGNIYRIGDLNFLNKIEADSVNNRWGFFVEVSSTAVEQIRIQDGVILPVITNDIDLGSATFQFKDLYLDGTANIDSLVLSSGSTVTAILDEDSLVSDSSTALATQQSIKAYVDAQVTAQDLDFQGDTGGALSIDLDSETLTIAGGTGIDTVGATNTLTVSIDSTVATLTGTQTLTNKTIDADNNTVSNLEVDNLKTGVLDTDISSVAGTHTTLPSALAVKTYVDAQVTAQDLDIFGDTGTDAIDLDSETLTFTGGTGITSVVTAGTVTHNIDSTVATLTGTQTLTNKTLTSPTISGNLTTDGNIDGRDVAADGTKLDGIEAGATADQTAAEIRALVEAATDSNVFTDADHTKLNGIEALADVTDTTNVTAAGALMDSELTNITAVKALNQGVATTDSPSFAGLTATTADINAGTIDGTVIGGSTPAAVTTTALVATTADINAGTIDNTVIGGTTPAAVTTSSLVATTADINAGTIDGTVIGGTTPAAITGTTITGTSFVSSGDMTFGDSDKAIFGAGSDLQIYHDGSNSYVQDAGDGALILNTTNGGGVYVYSAGETMATFNSNGAVNLYYDNAAKLATTATGIDVTGTVTADGLAVAVSDAALAASIGTDAQRVYITPSGTVINYNASGDSAGSHLFQTGNVNRLNIASNGDLSLYEDTGTTAKLFWDASEERLGIGTTSPSVHLDVEGTAQVNLLEVTHDGDRAVNFVRTGANTFSIEHDITQFYFWNQTTSESPLLFQNDGDVIMNGGNVGIGTSSPAYKAQISDSGNTVLSVTSGDSSSASLYLGDSVATRGRLTYDNSSDSLAVYTDNNERMRIDSSGNVGIGVVPSSWASNTFDALQLGVGIGVGNLTARVDGINAVGLGLNWYYGGGATNTYVASSYATNYVQEAGTHKWLHAASGTAGAALTFTESMRIDSSGNVGIGANSPTTSLTLGTGTTGVSFQSGSLALNSGKIAVIKPIELGTGNGHLVFETYEGGSGGGERMRIDSAGNVGIGGTQASSKLFVDNGAGTRLYIGLSNNIYADAYEHIWRSPSAASERMRIDASGNLLVGRSSAGAAATDNGHVFYGSGQHYIFSNATECVRFYETSGSGQQVGSISITSSATAFNTSSDERLKENITDAPAGNVDDIKVRSFDWKADGSHQDYGMVAQELEAVAPYAVTKGETEDDMWSVDYSKLVPMLIKEIQDLKAEVAALKGAN